METLNEIIERLSGNSDVVYKFKLNYNEDDKTFDYQDESASPYQLNHMQAIRQILDVAEHENSDGSAFCRFLTSLIDSSVELEEISLLSAFEMDYRGFFDAEILKVDGQFFGAYMSVTVPDGDSDSNSDSGVDARTRKKEENDNNGVKTFQSGNNLKSLDLPADWEDVLFSSMSSNIDRNMVKVVVTDGSVSRFPLGGYMRTKAQGAASGNFASLLKDISKVNSELIKEGANLAVIPHHKNIQRFTTIAAYQRERVTPVVSPDAYRPLKEDRDEDEFLRDLVLEGSQYSSSLAPNSAAISLMKGEKPLPASLMKLNKLNPSFRVAANAMTKDFPSLSHKFCAALNDPAEGKFSIEGGWVAKYAKKPDQGDERALTWLHKDVASLPYASDGEFERVVQSKSCEFFSESSSFTCDDKSLTLSASVLKKYVSAKKLHIGKFGGILGVSTKERAAPATMTSSEADMVMNGFHFRGVLISSLTIPDSWVEMAKETKYRATKKALYSDMNSTHFMCKNATLSGKPQATQKADAAKRRYDSHVSDGRRYGYEQAHPLSGASTKPPKPDEDDDSNRKQDEQGLFDDTGIFASF